LAAKAGIGGNEGTIYEALGLEQKSPAEIADGSGWANRPNRDTWDSWKKRPYAQPLGPPGVRFRRFDKHDRWQKARGQDESLPGAQSRLSSLKTAEGVSVDDCYLMRYDHHFEGVRDFFDRLANRPPKVEEATAIFVAAANDEPIAMHLCEPGSGDESDQLALVDYAHRETGVNYPVNVGAWTAGKAREWASLSGYEGIIGRPESVSHRAVLERANIPIRG
jgi:hypothetical protein